MSEVWIVENRFDIPGIYNGDWHATHTQAWPSEKLAEECKQRFIKDGVMGEFRVTKYVPARQP